MPCKGILDNCADPSVAWAAARCPRKQHVVTLPFQGDLEQYAALSVARAEASYYCTLCALRLALQSAGGLAPDELEALTEDLVQVGWEL